MRIFSRMMLLLSMLLAVAGCNTTVTPTAIIVGHVSDKTRLDKAGDQAELGIRLALHDLMKDGALAETFGGRKIHVHHTDTKGEIDGFESEAVRLFSVNRAVTILGGLSAKEVTALDHVKAPVLTFHGQPVTGASNQVTYVGMSATRQGEILAKLVALSESKNLVVILDERRPDRAALVESFQKALFDERKMKEKGSPAVATVRFGNDAKWDDLSERIHGTAPDRVLFAGDAKDLNTFYKPFREHNAQSTELIFAGNDGEHRLFDFAAHAKEAIVMVTAFHADPTSDKIATFVKMYEQKFQARADVHAALAYDAMRMLIEAMKRTPAHVTPEKVREELLKTKDFDGLTGPLTINSERQVQRTLYAVRWQDGVQTSIKTFPP